MNGSKHAAQAVVVRWDEGAPDESEAAYRVFTVERDEFVGSIGSDSWAETRQWAEDSGYEVVRVVLSDAHRAVLLGVARGEMERAIEGTRQAIENEVRAGLRHVAAVAAVLAPTATHVVFAMGDEYDNPVYTPYLLINADAPPNDMIDTQVVWSVEWHHVGANEIRGLLRLVAVGAAFDDPMIEVALDDAEGDAVMRGAYLSGDGPVVVPLSKLR